jgi:hypothetical protein
VASPGRANLESPPSSCFTFVQSGASNTICKAYRLCRYPRLARWLDEISKERGVNVLKAWEVPSAQEPHTPWLCCQNSCVSFFAITHHPIMRFHEQEKVQVMRLKVFSMVHTPKAKLRNRRNAITIPSLTEPKLSPTYRSIQPLAKHGSLRSLRPRV